MTSSLLSIGSRALNVAQGALSTVSHNIANANTEGYSRQDAVLATAGGRFTGAGFFGQGVQISTVRRNYDQFLTGSVQQATATSAADQARSTGLQALDAVFGDPALGIGASLDSFYAAAGDLANRPADTATRQVFLARAQQLAQRSATVGGQLQELVAQADSKLKFDVVQVNTRLDEVHRLNDQIARLKGTGQPPNDLLDQRDAAITALNELMAVRTVEQDDGSLAVFAAAGAPLLVGAQQSVLAAVPDPSDPARTAVRLTVGGTSQWMDADAVGGGSIAGTLRLRDQDLAAALNQVGRIATVVADAVNDQQALGVDAAGVPGKPLFTVPGPAARARDGNAGSGAVGVTINDPAALQPSDYDVRWDGSQYNVLRLSDNKEFTGVTLPAVIDGMRLTTTGTPAAGDSWRVRPFAAAATGLAVQPLSTREVATGYAATVQTAAANRGSVAATGFAVVRQDPANAAAVTLTFTSATTFDITGVPGGPLTGQPYVPGGKLPPTGDWNGWSLTLDGTPAAGDVVRIGATPSPAADNRNALALQGLANAALLADGTLNQAYAALVGDVGNRVQTGRAAADVSQALQAEAVRRQQTVAGVNLDEEAANLLRYQQAYQACARIVQASQTLFDTLLAATGR
jgi:flagellar hook-associated protein 1 FlgK